MTQTAYDISVIICAYTEDRWNDHVAAIETVQQQTLPPEEFIVVNEKPTVVREIVAEERLNRAMNMYLTRIQLVEMEPRMRQKAVRPQHRRNSSSFQRR